MPIKFLFLNECLNFTRPFQPSLTYFSVIQEHFFGFIQLFRSKLEFLKHGTNTFAQGSRIFPSKKEPAVAARGAVSTSVTGAMAPVNLRTCHLVPIDLRENA